jgi:hypothetical protein
MDKGVYDNNIKKEGQRCEEAEGATETKLHCSNETVIS